jgi:hypothetical protein
MNRAAIVPMTLWSLALGAVMLAAPGISRAGHPAEPMSAVLGLSPGMSEHEAHRRLSRLGDPQENSEREGGEGTPGVEREIWKLRDPRYAWLELAIDTRHRVRAIVARLRVPGPGLRYSEVGELPQARQSGYFIYDWWVPGRSGRAGRRVTARGTDSVTVASVTISGVH